MDSKIELILGDCLEKMKDIQDKSIDMILCDLPYGTTACEWDIIIPFKPLCDQYERIIKDCGCIALFGSEPFSSYLRMSNIKNYKYDWIWDKIIPSGMQYDRYQPMKQHENISIFSKEKIIYNPQMMKRSIPIKSGGQKNLNSESTSLDKHKIEGFSKIYNEKNPTTILSFNKVRKGSIHRAQKPVDLLEYLIKTYTNENNTVLDNCMGSGSTGIACMNTNRNFIGIEKEKLIYDNSVKRIKENKDRLYFCFC
jgi:site-specific DNA-methyltransferase (adenine-specific)